MAVLQRHLPENALALPVDAFTAVNGLLLGTGKATKKMRSGLKSRIYQILVSSQPELYHPYENVHNVAGERETKSFFK